MVPRSKQVRQTLVYTILHRPLRLRHQPYSRDWFSALQPFLQEVKIGQPGFFAFLGISHRAKRPRQELRSHRGRILRLASALSSPFARTMNLVSGRYCANCRLSLSVDALARWIVAGKGIRLVYKELPWWQLFLVMIIAFLLKTVNVCYGSFEINDEVRHHLAWEEWAR